MALFKLFFCTEMESKPCCPHPSIRAYLVWQGAVWNHKSNGTTGVDVSPKWRSLTARSKKSLLSRLTRSLQYQTVRQRLLRDQGRLRRSTASPGVILCCKKTTWTTSCIHKDVATNQRFWSVICWSRLVNVDFWLQSRSGFCMNTLNVSECSICREMQTACIQTLRLESSHQGCCNFVTSQQSRHQPHILLKPVSNPVVFGSPEICCIFLWPFGKQRGSLTCCYYSVRQKPKRRCKTTLRWYNMFLKYCKVK